MQGEIQPYVCRDRTLESRRQAVERVILTMRQRLDEPLSLKEMANIAFISPYHFNRVFHQITGLPPTKFLYAMRLEAAKRLLLMTDESVTDICFEVGYNSLGTFTRRFSELSGISPRRFRMIAQSPAEIVLNRSEDFFGIAPKLMCNNLVGNVDAPEDFNGIIFIGLFETPIPEKKPLVGTVISRAGVYCISPLPEGQFYLLATGLSWSEDPKKYFLYDSALRGGGQLIKIRNGVAEGVTNISLRPPSPFDPPILLTLPLLLSKDLGKGIIAHERSGEMTGSI